jgi:hypothetical protein
VSGGPSGEDQVDLGKGRKGESKAMAKKASLPVAPADKKKKPSGRKAPPSECPPPILCLQEAEKRAVAPLPEASDHPPPCPELIEREKKAKEKATSRKKVKSTEKPAADCHSVPVADRLPHVTYPEALGYVNDKAAAVGGKKAKAVNKDAAEKKRTSPLKSKGAANHREEVPGSRRVS